jgi:hypothetical protein
MIYKIFIPQNDSVTFILQLLQLHFADFCADFVDNEYVARCAFRLSA